MEPRRRSVHVRRVSYLFALTLASCGGGGGGAEPAAPGAATPSAPAATGPAAPGPASSGSPAGSSPAPSAQAPTPAPSTSTPPPPAPVVAFQPWGPSLVSDDVAANEPGTSVARLSTGASVVAWVDDAQLEAQVFAADGGRSGPSQLLVNNIVDSRLFSVAPLNNGEWVLAWAGPTASEAAAGGPGQSVYFQRFTATGAPIGGRSQVGTVYAQVNQAPAVHVAADGAFVVGWTARSVTTANPARAYIARFSAGGVALAGPTAVSDMAGDQLGVSLLPQSSGTVLVSWRQASATGSALFYVRSFDAAGEPGGPEHQLVVPAEATAASATSTALSADRVAVAWIARNRVSWQVMSTDGTALGDPATLPAPSYELTRVKVIDAGGGRFYVLVQGSTQQSPQTNFSTITAQPVSSAGMADGTPLELVTRKIAGLTDAGLSAPSASFEFSASGGSDGHFAVVYQVCTDSAVQLHALVR